MVCHGKNFAGRTDQAIRPVFQVFRTSGVLGKSVGHSFQLAFIVQLEVRGLVQSTLKVSLSIADIFI